MIRFIRELFRPDLRLNRILKEMYASDRRRADKWIYHKTIEYSLQGQYEMVRLLNNIYNSNLSRETHIDIFTKRFREILEEK